MELKTLSYSSYKLYESCEWKWFLRYVLRLPEDDIPSGLLGHIAHDVCETITKACLDREIVFRKDKPLVPDSLRLGYLWREAKEKAESENPDVYKRIKGNDIKKVYESLVDLLRGDYTPYNSRSIQAEQRVEITISDVKILGKIDRIDKIDDETIEIIDYKTGKRQEFSYSNKKKEKDTYEDMLRNFQARLYYMVAKRLYPEYPHVLVTLIYLRDGGPYTLPFSSGGMNDTEDSIRERAEEIRRNVDPPRNRGWWCKHMCHYGDKTGLCDKIWNDRLKHGLDYAELVYKKDTNRNHWETDKVVTVPGEKTPVKT